MKIGIHIRAVALAMAFMLLVSSIGIAVNIHYCKGEADSIGIFTLAKKCDMCKQGTQIQADDCEAFHTSSCCDEDAIYNKLAANVPVVKALELKPVEVPVLFPHSISQTTSWLSIPSFEVENKETIPDTRPSVLQVFLI